MHFKTFILYTVLGVVSCNNTDPSLALSNSEADQANNSYASYENQYATINDIPLPPGFKRIDLASNSFGHWLQHVPLKKDKTVYLFNGDPKASQAAQFAVLNVSVGKQNLQQCADAVIRLRAEYLFSQHRFNEIVFKDNIGTAYLFQQPYNRNHFDKYLTKVFGMCGSASLSKQLIHQTYDSVAIGDVLIKGGFPGHVVIVMDVAVNVTGSRIYLLAQSYMPAQDIDVLKNPMNGQLSPWYEVAGVQINTPEYNFTSKELKTW